MLMLTCTRASRWENCTGAKIGFASAKAIHFVIAPPAAIDADGPLG